MDPRERLGECIDAAIESCGGDLPTAIEKAEESLRGLGDDSVDEILWCRGVAEFIYDARHHANTSIRSSGSRPADPKVIAGASSTVSEVGREYLYAIAGRYLGDLLGEELGAIADSEDAVAEGHRFNSRLLRKLMPLVGEGKTVKQAVTAKQLKRVFAELRPVDATAPMKPTGSVRSSGHAPRSRAVAAAAEK
jgi:hypothetical protein